MGAQSTDLTTLANVKEWLNLTTQSDDAKLARLISSVSQRVLQYLDHALLPQTVTRTFDGQHGKSLVLPDFPIISFSSLTIDTIVIPAAADVTQAGYLLASLNPSNDTACWELTLNGYTFTRGIQNVRTIYKTGFQTAEAITGVQTYNALRPFRQDGGVAYANGTALTPVASAPAVGQYVPPSLATATPAETYPYTFNASDAGASLVLTYGYTPEPVEQATIELVSRRYRERDRIGKKSDSHGQQTTSYDLSDMTEAIRAMLQPYCRVIPA